jgi:protein subunit release factor A
LVEAQAEQARPDDLLTARSCVADWVETSAATVQRMIDQNDIETFVWRGSEAEQPLAVRMAVRLIHKPTGIMAESSEHETQIANRETAMRRA